MKFDCNEWIKIVKFSTNKSWQITTDNSSWIRVSPNEGEAGDIKLHITINPNDSYSNRKDTVTIISDDITKIIKVTQSQKDEIKVYSDKYEVEADGESINVDIYSNINYGIKISKKHEDWISGTIRPNPLVSKSLTFNKLCFIIKKNESYESREGDIYIYIYITSDTITKTIKIKQNGQSTNPVVF